MARRPKTPNARKRPKRGLRTPPPWQQLRDAASASPTAYPLPAEFLRSAERVDQAPEDTGLELAFAGRSNAGKSSALNRLANRRGLARTSRTPGRTQLLNFFRITEGAEETAPERRLVDLPGYGYARTDRETRDAWQTHVEDYLSARASLVGLVLLMDVRHPFSAFDEHVLDWAGRSAMPTLLLLNKVDKLSRGATAAAVGAATERVAAMPEVRVHAFSALRGTGAEAVLATLRSWLMLTASTAVDATTGPVPARSEATGESSGE